MRLHLRLAGSPDTLCGLKNNFRLRSTTLYAGVNCPNCKRKWREQRAALPKEGEELDAIARAAAVAAEQWVRRGTWPASERPGNMAMAIAGFLEGFKAALSSLPVSGEVERAFRAGHAAGFDCADKTSRSEGGNADEVWEQYASRAALTPQQATDSGKPAVAS